MSSEDGNLDSCLPLHNKVFVDQLQLACLTGKKIHYWRQVGLFLHHGREKRSCRRLRRPSHRQQQASPRAVLEGPPCIRTSLLLRVFNLQQPTTFA